MKTIRTSVFAISILAVLGSCGNKKEQEDFGKQTEEVVVSEEITNNHLLDEGKVLFEGKGTCIACHKTDTKLIGPSLVEISKIYKEKNASIVSFLKEEGEAIVDPSQYEVMKANFAITKAMSAEELQALEAYIFSF